MQVPRTTCQEDDDDVLICTTSAGNNVYNKFYTDANGVSAGDKTYFWYIGSGSPVGITPFSVTAAEV